MPQPTLPRRVVSRALMALAGVVLLVVAYRVTAPSTNDLKAQGGEMIAAFERHRAEHGEYPASSAVAGVTLPTTRYGPWRYRPSDDRSWFELSVGDYDGIKPFTLYWSSKSGDWSLDR
jgi:hypothetical protein